MPQIAAALLAVSLACLVQTQVDPTRQTILEIQELIVRDDLAGARKSLNEAMRQHPADAGFDNLLGIIEAQEGHFPAAEQSFKRAIAKNRQFTNAYLNLGRLYQEHSSSSYGQGDSQALEHALETYQALLRYDPGNREANYQSAKLLALEGECKASLDHLALLAADARNTAQSLSISCGVYACLGDRQQADEAASRLLSHPDYSEADVRVAASILSRSGRDDLSLMLYEGLLKRQPLAPESMRQLGLTYERMGRLKEARTALEDSTRGAQSTPKTLADLARVAHKQKDYEGALGYLAHARELEPANAGLSYFFGLVCLDLNLLAEARNAFEQAVKLEPENASYNFAMGAASAFRRDPGDAIPYFQKYLQLKPDDPRGRLALGAALFRAKEYTRASEYLRLAAEFPETGVTAHYYLGCIARQQERLGDAIRELALAISRNPQYADALAELGQCHLLGKDYELAGRAFRQALEINPNHYAANFGLLTLYTRTRDPRVSGQSKRFEEVKKLRDETTQEFLRIVEVRPYPVP
jgi:tetratricopeptide (TPR) repeat protein